MKTTRILKSIIDILFYLLGLNIVLLIFVSFMSLLYQEMPILSLFFTKSIENKPLAIVLAFSNCVILVLFFIGIGNLREAIKCFIAKKFFNPKTVSSFRLAGIYFNITAVLGWLVRGFSIGYGLQDNNTNIGLHQNSLLLFMLICGLCFLVISRILKESIALKEENELTI